MFYLSLPEDLSEYDDTDVENFSMISPYLNRNMEYDSETGRYVTLYAITDKRELADEFELTHNMDLFVRIKRKLSPDECTEIFSAFENYKLGVVSFDNKYPRSRDIGVKYLLLTPLEEDILDDEDFNVEQTLCDYVDVDYSIFKEKYIRALDFLLYCTYNRLMHSCDPDYYDSNFSYGITAEGYPHHQVNLKKNILKLYIRFFALLLRKDK